MNHNRVAAYITKHSSDFLLGFGIAGSIISCGLAIGMTPKAMKKISNAKERLKKDKLSIFETIKECWKYYVPSLLTETAAITCLISSRKISAKREAALAAAYSLSETALKTYKEKVVETIGERKEEQIRSEIAKDEIQKAQLNGNTVIITSKGDTLCLDTISQRYFKSDIEKIRRAVNELNRRLRSDIYVSLNDFYSEINLDPIPIGNDLGWNIDKGYVEIDFSAALTEDETPCLVLEYSVAPKNDYDKII